MHQHSLKRLLFVALLAGGLTFAGPAAIHATPVDEPHTAWQWLARIWDEGVSAIWERPGAGRGERIHEKAGVCIDPNGFSCHAVTPAAGPTCHAWSEAGVCIDPNG